jgi:hypothetical protein
MEQFCSVIKRSNAAQPILSALAKWGLAEVQTMAMLYVYAHGRGLWVQRDQLWRESAGAIQAKMLQLAKKLRKFHNLPDSTEYIARLQAQSHGKVAPLALMLVPGGVEFAKSVKKLPDVLSAYGALLNHESVRRRPNPKLVRSRVLFLLYVALRHAEPSKSKYQAHKTIAALLTPLRPDGVDYKAVANRIGRFEDSYSTEATLAQSVITKSGASGVRNLMLMVESQRGFLLYHDD